MMGGMIILLSILMILAAAILAAEIYDRREDEIQKEIFRNGVRCRGRVISIQRKGILASRSAYPWRIEVEFEFDGRKYSIEEQSVSKPVFSVGDSIVVYVDQRDPDHSKAAI